MPAEKRVKRPRGTSRRPIPPGERPAGTPPGVQDRLEAYRAKRSVERTGEPFRSPPVGRPRLFVVQKHAARRTHYDFRLECGGTLWSWAVPHGLSADPALKRLAVHVEDHPVEYADFEGMIPEGNYGAGAVVVWDRGVWLPYDDPDQGIVSGKLHFELRGYKLRGVWTLVRIHKSEKDWLLIKKADAWAAPDGSTPWPEESILSGLTVEDLRDGRTPAGEIRARLVELAAPRRRVDPATLDLMLAETAEAPFSRSGWIFELKYDGYRLVAARRPDGSAFLRYRNGSDVTALFPDLARAMRALPFEGLVLDGEVVVLDEQGRPDFQRLQQRGRLQRRADIERAAVEHPAALLLFDLLGFEDFDLRPLPLLERKRLLLRLLPPAGPLGFADHVEQRGREMFEEVRKLGLEGVIAKKADAPYRSRRSAEWLKLVADHLGDFVVCGYTAPRASRAGLGALHLGLFDDGALAYVGRVGSGFSQAQLGALRAKLDAMRRPGPPCTGNVPTGKDTVWVDPAYVVEVRYKTWTDDGSLRHPVFVRLRDDQPIEECVHPRSREAARPVPEQALEPERTPRFTNLGKVFWPDEGTTKGALIDYYRTIAPWLLPYLRDRPLVLTRYPDGIQGKNFFQKNAPAFTPEWVRTERVWSEHAEREIDYLVCDDVETLLFLVNLGTIPLHVWSSRVETLQQPDWSILDLDPKGAPFEHVVGLALAVRGLCEEMGLPSFVKTSGSTGLHVLIPLGRQCTYEQSRMLAHLIARIVQEEHPENATLARAIGARGGRVYLDYLQNRHGQLLVAPFSVRPLPGAPVSTPLPWNEVNRRLDPRKLTIRTVPARLEKSANDPLRPVLEARPDLGAALARLTERMEGASRKPRRPRPRRSSS